VRGTQRIILVEYLLESITAELDQQALFGKWARASFSWGGKPDPGERLNRAYLYSLRNSVGLLFIHTYVFGGTKMLLVLKQATFQEAP